MSAKTTRVGVAWHKQTPDMRTYISVIITNPIGPDFRYTIWPVEQKQSENSPDYTVTKSADQPANVAPNTARPAAARPAVPDSFPADDDNIPF
jgi:uncharacterized protein (DUF736 family)